MPLFRFTVVEHDSEKPWLIVGDRQRLEVDLERAGDFHAWAAVHWPAPRYTAELDPGQEPRLIG